MVTSTDNAVQDDLDQKIIAQVEYYFSDLNLKQDKFMKNQMTQNDGWFPVEKLMTFNRLKNLTTDHDAVINSIKKLSSGLIELNEDGTKIHRLKPPAEESPEYVKELNLRTLHLKGFPKDSALDDIMKYCSEYGKVESIQMRRNFKKNGEFKGCIFVVYTSKDDAAKLLEPEELKYNELVLLRENKEKYFERKKEFYDSLKKKRGLNAEAGGDFIRTKGAILKLTGLAKDTKFNDIKEELSKHSKVAFVSNVNEEFECNVRFTLENGAKDALKALKEQAGNTEESDKLLIDLCGQQVEISLASEEQEKDFWKEFQSKQVNSNKGKNKWQKGKKRFNSNHGSKNKRVKSDD